MTRRSIGWPRAMAVTVALAMIAMTPPGASVDDRGTGQRRAPQAHAAQAQAQAQRQLGADRGAAAAAAAPSPSYTPPVRRARALPPVLYSIPGSGNTFVRLLVESVFGGGTTGSVYDTDRSLLRVLPGEAHCSRNLTLVKAHPTHFRYSSLFGRVRADKCTSRPPPELAITRYGAGGCVRQGHRSLDFSVRDAPCAFGDLHAWVLSTLTQPLPPRPSPRATDGRRRHHAR